MNDEYTITITNKSVDVILGLKLVHNLTEREIIIFSCYLPPEGSIHGRDAQGFYAHLLTQIYMHSESDYMFIGADFNARIGTRSDLSTDKHDVPIRNVLDRKLNQHGNDLIEFLNDSNFCVLNGRFGRGNYTSISRKGKAVVDYICVPLDTFSAIKYCKVLTMQELADEHRLHGLLGERSRLPDHSAILTQIELDYSSYESTTDNVDQRKHKRFKLRQIPQDCMQSELAMTAIRSVIRTIESARGTQSEVDSTYESLCSCISTEMKQTIPQTGSSSSHRKRKIARAY